MDAKSVPVIVHIASVARTFTQFRLPIIRSLADECQQILVFGPDEPHASRLKGMGFETRELAIRPRGLSDVPKARHRLQQLLAELRPTLVVAHQPKAALIAIPTAKRLGIMCVYSTGGLKTQIPPKTKLDWLVWKVERRLVLDSAATLTVNEADTMWINTFPSLKGRGLYVGPNGGAGIDLQRFKSHRIDKNSIVRIGYLGRLTREKGIHVLLEAFSLATQLTSKKSHLTIAGDGPARRRLERFVHRLGIADSVEFLGYVEDVPSLLNEIDVFVLPSRREGLPIALLEAMASGASCIATDVRGSRELSGDGKNVALVKYANAQELAHELINLIDSPDARRALGLAGADAAKRYSMEKLLPRTVQVYRRFLETST